MPWLATGVSMALRLQVGLVHRSDWLKGAVRGANASTAVFRVSAEPVSTWPLLILRTFFT